MTIYETSVIEDDLDQCEDTEDFVRLVLPKLRGWRELWQIKVAQILSGLSGSRAELARLCQVSETMVRKWEKGALPQSRNMYQRIGFAAGYGLDDFNDFLMRYGRCPQLYAKSLEDSICMFVLNSSSERSYLSYCRALEKARDYLQQSEAALPQSYPTEQMKGGLLRVRSEEELLAFICEHADAYREAYHRLYNYILLYLDLNLEIPSEQSKTSFHAMASESNWPSSLRHCIGDIRKRRWFPLRQKVISLGIHLNMDVDSINEMLLRAQMAPLYVKNPMEAAIKFAVREACLCSETDEIIPDGSDSLYQYVKDILARIGLSEDAGFLNDL